MTSFGLGPSAQYGIINTGTYQNNVLFKACRGSWKIVIFFFKYYFQWCQSLIGVSTNDSHPHLFLVFLSGVEWRQGEVYLLVYVSI